MTAVTGKGQSGAYHAFQEYGRVDPETIYQGMRQRAERDLAKILEFLDLTREDLHATTYRGVIVSRGEEVMPWPERDDEIKQGIKRRTVQYEGQEVVLPRPGWYIRPSTGVRVQLIGVMAYHHIENVGGGTGWPSFWPELIREGE